MMLIARTEPGRVQIEFLDPPETADQLELWERHAGRVALVDGSPWAGEVEPRTHKFWVRARSAEGWHDVTQPVFITVAET